MLLDEGITFSQKDNVYSLFMLCLILKKDLKKLTVNKIKTDD